MLYMKERCGAFQVGSDREVAEIEFRVFLPSGPDPEIEFIRVAGEFNSSSAEKRGIREARCCCRPGAMPAGDFFSARTHAAVPAGFYEYKYRSFRRWRVPDRVGSLHALRRSGNRTRRVVVGGSPPRQRRAPLQGGRRPLPDLDVYELMIDDFTDELPRRRGRRSTPSSTDSTTSATSGSTAILFMPWTAWRTSDFDWGYEPFQYFAVEARYAHDLLARRRSCRGSKRLVSECHAAAST